MNLDARLLALVQAIGADIKTALAGGGSGGNPTVDATVPAAPAANKAAIYARAAGRTMVGFKSPDGDSVTLQPHLGRNRASWWQANGNTTVASLEGLVAGTNLGTPALIAVATTNLVTRMRRIFFTTTATAGTLGGHWFGGQLMWTTGSGTGDGGFHFVVTFSPAFVAAAATARYFLGLSASTVAPTNVEPQSVIQSIGIGKIAGSQNLHIIVNGNAAQTPIDLGSGFLASNNRLYLFRASFYSSSMENGVIRYTVENLSLGTETSGVITPATVGVTTPSSLILLQPRWWITNNAVAAAIGLDVGTFYIETDN